jgi:hypothetical protein
VIDHVRIGVSPGTKLFALTRGHYNNKAGWAAWIAVDPRRLLRSPEHWHGTFLFLCDDGSMLRVTTDTDGLDRVMEIKDAE